MLRLKLYDERSGRLVTWAQARRSMQDEASSGAAATA
jgi:hypothetical protein